MINRVNDLRDSSFKKDKVLLMLMPFWAPLIPPLGISCLKSYLNKYGYNVKLNDVNLETDIWDMQHIYLNSLKRLIPENNYGNFYMIGYDVLMNHLMVHINYTEEDKYIELMKDIISKNFRISIPNSGILELINTVKIFYEKLEKYLIQLFEKEKPDVLGISCYSVTLAPSLFAFRLIKSMYPSVRTVMGGGVYADQLANNSPNLEAFLKKTPYIDKLIMGESEIIFLKYLQGELPEHQKIYTLKDIGNSLLDLSTVDIPDFSDLDVDQYTQLAGYTSRSCPFQCSFCSETVQWGAYRKKNANQIVNELSKMSEKYKRKLFLLGDSLVNPIVNQLAEEFISRKINIYWDGYLRADKEVCNMENTKLWRRGGFYRARLGIESGSQHVLDLMNKHITVEQIKAAIYSLAKAGIKTTTYWVVGHPGETEEDFKQTLDLIEECRDDIYEVDWHPFYFFPNGQVNSEKWVKENSMSLLYPEWAADMLISQTWVLNTFPNRDEVYDRMCRFEKHCKSLGIPNPYSLMDIYKADERWLLLHKDAVPALIDLC